LYESNEEEVVDFDHSSGCFIKQRVESAAMSEKGIRVGGKGTVHLNLEELGTSTLGYIETGGTCM
jgi:hypothetical protein